MKIEDLVFLNYLSEKFGSEFQLSPNNTIYWNLPIGRVYYKDHRDRRSFDWLELWSADRDKARLVFQEILPDLVSRGELSNDKDMLFDVRKAFDSWSNEC